jgi:hypothetical protein
MVKDEATEVENAVTGNNNQEIDAGINVWKFGWFSY